MAEQTLTVTEVEGNSETVGLGQLNIYLLEKDWSYVAEKFENTINHISQFNENELDEFCEEHGLDVLAKKRLLKGLTNHSPKSIVSKPIFIFEKEKESLEKLYNQYEKVSKLQILIQNSISDLFNSGTQCQTLIETIMDQIKYNLETHIKKLMNQIDEIKNTKKQLLQNQLKEAKKHYQEIGVQLQIISEKGKIDINKLDLPCFSYELNTNPVVKYNGEDIMKNFEECLLGKMKIDTCDPPTRPQIYTKPAIDFIKIGVKISDCNEDVDTVMTEIKYVSEEEHSRYLAFKKKKKSRKKEFELNEKKDEKNGKLYDKLWGTQWTLTNSNGEKFHFQKTKKGKIIGYIELLDLPWFQWIAIRVHIKNEHGKSPESNIVIVKENGGKDNEYLQTYAKQINDDDINKNIMGAISIRKLTSTEIPPIVDIMKLRVEGKLIQFLKSKNETLAFNACWALTNLMAFDIATTKKIMKQGVLKPMIKLFKKSTSNEIAEQAIWGLGNLISDAPEAIQTMYDNGVFEKLEIAIQRAFKNDEDDYLKTLTWVIDRISEKCGSELYRIWDKFKNVVTVLIPVLKTEHNEVRINILHAFALLSENIRDEETHIFDHFIKNGLISYIISVFKKVKKYSKGKVSLANEKKYNEFLNIGTIQPCIRIVGNFVASSDEITQIVVNYNIINYFEDLLKFVKDHKNNERSQKELFWLLSNILAGNEKQVESVLNHKTNIIKLCCNCIKESNSINVQKEAMWCVANSVLTCSQDSIYTKIIKNGAIDTLSYMLKSPCNDKAKQASLEPLITMLGVLQNVNQKKFEKVKKKLIDLEIDKVVKEFSNNPNLSHKANEFAWQLIKIISS